MSVAFFLFHLSASRNTAAKQEDNVKECEASDIHQWITLLR